jgi:hypothetical protein
MSRLMKFVIGVVAIASLGANLAMAQGFRDAGAKSRGEFGTSFHTSGTRPARAYYAAPAPQFARAMPAPMVAPAAPEVAQVPTDRQSFSLEPSQAQPAPAAPQVIRRYSYEPSTRTDRAGAWTGRRSDQRPTYLLPKTDPRKFGG